MVRYIEHIKSIRSLVTVGGIYIVSDLIYDAALCYFPQPIGWCFYAARYSALITYCILKFCKSAHLKRTQFPAHGYDELQKPISASQRKKSPLNYASREILEVEELEQ